ncbi:hypothetical protein GCM10017620_26160 [Brevundimonas intermedia]|uniref:Uncharacterized protein n=1 Tax=Brevundimonas intermedia TaxID=74315 RepID=A0ABQ5TBA6_9CAUL|nr:hypothetical protein GCM10017620_26160 [Brevundimonas intermedia]
MAIGGGDFCDDSAWPDCQGAGFCLRPFASPIALLHLPLSQAELLELADELAAPPPDPVWIGYDTASPDEVVLVKPTDLGKTSSSFLTFVRTDHASLALGLATVSLTGAGESPVVATAMPAVPLRSDDGATNFSEASASPVSTGTPC